MCDNRKSRRSSILKLPKQRTPLCDVDCNPPTRRVSFANSNFIKEFTADPEKNTIWHNSYEESIISVKSEDSKTKDAEQGISNTDQEEIVDNASDRDDFNNTRLEFFEEENSLAKNSSDDSITSARVDLNNFKEQTSHTMDTFVLQEPPQFQEITCKNAFLPGQQSSVSFLPNLEFSQMIGNEMSLGNIKDMSAKLSATQQQTFLFDATTSTDMDFTQTIPSNFANLKLSKQMNAEITRSIPPNSKLMRQILNAKRQTLNRTTTEQNQSLLNNTTQTQKNDFEMNVTQCVPSSARKSKRQTINFNQEGLDMTSTVGTTNIDVNKENILMISPQNITLYTQNPTEFEMTEPIPAHVNQLINSQMAKNRRHTINYKTENIENDGMEITESIPQGFNFANARKSENMEDQADDVETITEAEKENIPTTSKRQTIYFNTQNSDEAEMEQTKVISSLIIPQLEVSIANSSKIDLQQKNPSKHRQTINFKMQNEDSDMDITKIDPNLQQLSDMSNINNNMEMTTAITNNTVTNRQTINLQKTPQLDNKNIDNVDIVFANSSKINLQHKNRQTINFQMQDEEEDMDITKIDPNLQQLSDMSNINNNMEMTTAISNNAVPNHQTFNFQKTPQLDFKSVENVDVALANSSKINLQHKNRQTINFQMQNEEDMDITKMDPNLQQLSDMSNINNNMKMTTAITNNTVTNRQTIHLLKTPQLADKNFENMDVPLENSCKINLQHKNRQTINFQMQNEGDMDITKIDPNLQQIPNMSIINNENMEISRQAKLQSKNKMANRQTINFKQNFESAGMEIIQTVPCAINTKLVNVIISQRNTMNRAEDNMELTKLLPTELKIRHSTVVEKENSAIENLNPQIDDESGDYPARINIVTKKPCSSSIRRTINLQSDKSLIITDDSTVPKRTNDKDESIHMISSNETPLKISQNITKDSLTNAGELSETKMVLNQITDLLEDINASDTMEGVAKKTPDDDNQEVAIEKMETILHFKDYPLVVNANQAANESGKSDICQRIKYLGEEEESFHRSKLNFTSYSNPNSCSVSKNLSSFVDNTEKLINYKPELVGSSEYTKIINEEIIFSNGKRTSLENIDELANVPHKVNKIESIITTQNTSDSNNIVVIQDDAETNTNNVFLSNSNCSIISINSSSDDGTEQKEVDSDSFVNEFNISNIKSPPKTINILSADNSSGDSENEVLWRSLVEKSKCYDYEMLSSVDISLVDSFEISQTPNQFEVSVTEEREYKKPECSVTDALDKRMNTLKNKHPIPKQKKKIVATSTKLIKQYNQISKKTETEPEIVIVEKQIKQKSQDALWSIKELKDDLFSFVFMFNTIEAVSQIETDTGIVKDVKFYSTFCEKTSDPTAVYCQHIVIKKLTSNIKSAIGSSYTILSLLDYVALIEEQILDILYQFNNLELQYGVDFDSNLNVKMQFTNVYLTKAFEVLINLNKLDNLTEEDIIVTPLVGQIDKFTIKRLIKQCPRGVPLLKAFILNVKEYLSILQNNR